MNTLDKMAVNYAENTQDNNPFDVNNRVWLTNLGPRWKKLKGYQDKVSYLSSPEFTDFQALLNFFLLKIMTKFSLSFSLSMISGTVIRLINANDERL